MKIKIIILLFIITIIYFNCSTEIEEGPIIPTAPTVNYSYGTNTPSLPFIDANYTGSYGSLKAVISWRDVGNSVNSYNIYRDGQLISTINKQDGGTNFGIGCYVYTDTAPSQGIHTYGIESVGVNGKKSTISTRSIGCTNYSSIGNLSGTYYTYETNYNYFYWPPIIESIEKHYIGGASIVAVSTVGDKVGYTKSEADGNFSISGLPQGTYNVYLSHPSYVLPGNITVSISAGATTTTNVEY